MALSKWQNDQAARQVGEEERKEEGRRWSRPGGQDLACLESKALCLGQSVLTTTHSLPHNPRHNLQDLVQRLKGFVSPTSSRRVVVASSNRPQPKPELVPSSRPPIMPSNPYPTLTKQASPQ